MMNNDKEEIGRAVICLTSKFSLVLESLGSEVKIINSLRHESSHNFSANLTLRKQLIHFKMWLM